jgi:LmbE family N-acetylglucosaminyl deacetylase
MNKRILIALAHPDDESFGLGALIARYVNEGAEVYYICATDGAAGTVSPEHMNGHTSIAALREAELDAASAILGFKHVYKFNYPDSGMMGSETSQQPDSFWSVYNMRPDEVIRRVVEVIREVQPQVVVTFNKYGAYGHPDHIAIQRATTEAFTLAGDASYDTGQPPYAPQKLYYNNIPKNSIRTSIWLLRLRGQDPRRIGRNKDIDVVAILENTEPTHTRVDIRDWYDVWDQASACHLSQGGGGGFRVFPKWTRRFLAPYQGFTRVYPRPQYDKVDEYDMFDNVRVDEPLAQKV